MIDCPTCSHALHVHLCPKPSAMPLYTCFVSRPLPLSFPTLLSPIPSALHARNKTKGGGNIFERYKCVPILCRTVRSPPLEKTQWGPCRLCMCLIPILTSVPGSRLAGATTVRDSGRSSVLSAAQQASRLNSAESDDAQQCIFAEAFGQQAEKATQQEANTLMIDRTSLQVFYTLLRA